MPKFRDLPPRCYRKHGAFYFVDTANKWHRLGSELEASLAVYHRLYAPAGAAGSMQAVIIAAMPSVTRGRSESTVRQYRACAVRLQKVFAEFQVADVRPKHIAKIKAAMINTPNMANRMLSVMKMIFTYATEHELCEWNPTVGVKPYPEAKRERLLSLDEIEAIRAVSPPRLQAMIDILRITGQRIGDVVAIRRADIVDEGVMFKQKKTGIKLLVAWNADLREAVARALALQTQVKSMFLFCSRYGKPPAYKTVRDQWDAAVERAGVQDAHLHDLRAVAITEADSQGVSAQALAGHTSASMTARYVRGRVHTLVTPPSLSKKVSKKA